MSAARCSAGPTSYLVVSVSPVSPVSPAARAMHDLDVWQSGNLQFTWLLKLRWSGLHLSLSLKRALNLGSASFMARTKSPGAASGYSTMSASGMGTFDQAVSVVASRAGSQEAKEEQTHRKLTQPQTQTNKPQKPIQPHHTTSQKLRPSHPQDLSEISVSSQGGATIPESHAGHRGVLGNALTSDLAMQNVRGKRVAFDADESWDSS